MKIAAKIDIVVVNWNSGKMLQNCIRSILNSDCHELVGKIIVVDNASSDSSIDFLPSEDRINVIMNTENRGFAVACNQGIEHCNSAYYVMLNPDVVLQHDTLVRSFEFMEARKDIDIMGCMQLDENGSVQPSCSRFPTPFRIWNDATGLSKFFPKFFTPSTLMTDWDHLESRKVDQIIGSYMFIRQQTFERIGLFDPRFFVYYEELDLSKRLAEAGGLSFYNHNIRLMHIGNGTTQKVRAYSLFLNLNSRLEYSQKHFSRWGYRSVWIATLMIEPVTRLIFSLGKEGATGFKNTYKGYSMLWKKRINKK